VWRLDSPSVSAAGIRSRADDDPNLAKTRPFRSCRLRKLVGWLSGGLTANRSRTVTRTWTP
jgi:hypothetical protein